VRSDTAGLRTWWIAGFTIWALAVWISTLLGLGGRTGAGNPATDVPDLPALPAALTTDPAALDNAEALARPVFAADRRPHRFLLEGAQSQTGAVRLTGVLMTPGLEMATVTTEQGQSLRLRLGGEPESGWRLISLRPRSAVVDGPSGTIELVLQVFSGSGVASGAGADQPAVAAQGTQGMQEQAPPAVPATQAAPTAGAVATEAQIHAIRERIQARRRQLQLQQQNPAVRPANQNP